MDILNRIQDKLIGLKRLDRNLEIFGANHHKYKSIKINPEELEQFEKENSIILPEELATFLLHIGYGAGPDYGIYSLSEFTSYSSKPYQEYELNNKGGEELFIKNKNRISNFKKLKTLNGILLIQTSGCTFYHYIVVTGEERGKIWAFNDDNFETFPVKGQNFYDWYENWLDESISKLKKENNEKRTKTI